LKKHPQLKAKKHAQGPGAKLLLSWTQRLKNCPN